MNCGCGIEKKEFIHACPLPGVASSTVFGCYECDDICDACDFDIDDPLEDEEVDEVLREYGTCITEINEVRKDVANGAKLLTLEDFKGDSTDLTEEDA